MKNNRIPPLTDSPSDIGDRYMVARHRKTILEGMGLAREEIPNKAEDQIIMLKAFKAEQPEKYNAKFDLYVRQIEPDLTPQAVSDKDIDAVKKEALAEMRALFDELQKSLVNSGNSKEVVLNIARDSAISTMKDIVGEYSENLTEQITNRVEDEIELALKKVVTIEHSIKIGEMPEIKTKSVLPDEFDKVLSLAVNRVNVFITGPSGCGKTHLAAEIAKVMNLDFYGQSCSAGMSESIFSGWLLPTGDSGKFEYVQSPFIKAYENGGVFLFDEIDAADGNTMLFLNQALANDRFFLPQRFDNPVVMRNPNFVAIAAANTYGNGADNLYNSRNALDAASMDRFRMGVVAMDYSAKVEEQLVHPEILNIGRRVRELIAKNKFRKIMSTRFLLDATKMKRAGWGYVKIFNSYFADWSDQEERLAHGIIGYCQQADQSGGDKVGDEIEDDEIVVPKKIEGQTWQLGGRNSGKTKEQDEARERARWMADEIDKALRNRGQF